MILCRAEPPYERYRSTPSPGDLDRSRVYHGLAPGSKHNDMAAILDVHVSRQIDDLTNSMNLREEDRLEISKKIPDVNKDCREREKAKTNGLKTRGEVII